MNIQIDCSICGNQDAAEFYEPCGIALCLECGTTFRRLCDLLIALGNLEPDQITPDASFIDHLNMDSLDVAELFVALEEEGVEVTREEAAKIKTVKDLVRVVNARRGIDR